MPKERPTTRGGRRQEKRTNYLHGKSRNLEYLQSSPVSHEATESDQGTSGVYPSCSPILSRYADTFKELTHGGGDLKRRKWIYPTPKTPNVEHYRDVKHQNEWLRENVFDPMGNYLFCSRCICKAFGISDRRLTCQRNVKRSMSTEPLIHMNKCDVVAQRLANYVIMPKGSDQSFARWWQSLPDTTSVEVCYPHQHHGNARRPSNSSKPTVREDFLNFVDCNVQPNSRSADSSGPTHYFVSAFITIQVPKKGVANFEERKARSVVGEFNRIQEENGKQGCSNGSASNWLKEFRPKVAICPHKLDYCDTCAKYREDLQNKQDWIDWNKQDRFQKTKCVY